MENLQKRIDARVADRVTIAERFNTEPLTTHRILQNLNFNFIKYEIAGGDEQLANELWKEAHPFKYPAHDSRDFHSMDLDFVEKYLKLFGGKQFWTSAGWGKYDEVKKCIPWVYDSGYSDVELEYNN